MVINVGLNCLVSYGLREFDREAFIQEQNNRGSKKSVPGESNRLDFLQTTARLIVKKFISPVSEDYQYHVEHVENLIKEVLVSEDGRKYQFEFDNEEVRGIALQASTSCLGAH